MEEKLPIISDEIIEPHGENSASDNNNGAVDGHQVGKSVDMVTHDHEVEKSVEPVLEKKEDKEVLDFPLKRN